MKDDPTPEQIVRDFAAFPIGDYCPVCDRMAQGNGASHAEWCYWRLAVEWVTAHPVAYGNFSEDTA